MVYYIRHEPIAIKHVSMVCIIYQIYATVLLLILKQLYHHVVYPTLSLYTASGSISFDLIDDRIHGKKDVDRRVEIHTTDTATFVAWMPTLRALTEVEENPRARREIRAVTRPNFDACGRTISVWCLELQDNWEYEAWIWLKCADL